MNEHILKDFLWGIINAFKTRYRDFGVFADPVPPEINYPGILGLGLFLLVTAFILFFSKSGQNLILYGSVYRPNFNPQYRVLHGFHIVFWIMSVFALSLLIATGGLLVQNDDFVKILLGFIDLLFR